MNQQQLWHDTLSDALRSVVEGCNPKRVASELWPTMQVRDAHRRLLHCLDDERSEKLSLDEMVYLLRVGRDNDIHTGLAWLCEACGYAAPVPVSREEKRDQLREEAARLADRLEGVVREFRRLET